MVKATNAAAAAVSSINNNSVVVVVVGAVDVRVPSFVSALCTVHALHIQLLFSPSLFFVISLSTSESRRAVCRRQTSNEKEKQKYIVLYEIVRG
jgi:hypothetical protein